MASILIKTDKNHQSNFPHKEPKVILIKINPFREILEIVQISQTFSLKFYDSGLPMLKL